MHRPGAGDQGEDVFCEKTPLPTVAALRFPALSGPPIAPLPRNRLACSAAGGASPVSPLNPHQKRGGVSTSPPHSLTTQRGGGSAPPLWIPLPELGGLAPWGLFPKRGAEPPSSVVSRGSGGKSKSLRVFFSGCGGYFFFKKKCLPRSPRDREGAVKTLF